MLRSWFLTPINNTRNFLCNSFHELYGASGAKEISSSAFKWWCGTASMWMFHHHLPSWWFWVGPSFSLGAGFYLYLPCTSLIPGHNLEPSDLTSVSVIVTNNGFIPWLYWGQITLGSDYPGERIASLLAPGATITTLLSQVSHSSCWSQFRGG